ncbi:hypothetical protein B7P43_G13960, partial [Cryptotermes secundus]
KWVQTATTDRDPRLKDKITRYKDLSHSNKTNYTPMEVAKIAYTSTLKPNRTKYEDEENCTKQNEMIPKKRDIQVDLRNDPNWAKNLSVWQRLFAHHTLSSMRQSVAYVCCNAPQDKLDFVLDSIYRHDAEVFPDITDVHLQPETLGHKTWRVLRNTKHIPPPEVPSRGHPIRFGGTGQHPDIYNVKLGIPAPHVAQTNAGYSRREDGALYKV